MKYDLGKRVPSHNVSSDLASRIRHSSGVVLMWWLITEEAYPLVRLFSRIRNPHSITTAIETYKVPRQP